jgi:hypothetical protein
MAEDVVPPGQLAGTTGALPNLADTSARAEADDYIDLGAERKMGHLTLGLDGWWRRASNMLDETYNASGSLAQPFNFASGRGWGVEFSTTWSEGPISAWGNAAVSWLEGREIISGQAPFTSAELTWAVAHYVPANADQRIAASGGVAWHKGPLRLSADATYGSGLPRASPEGTPNGASLPATVRLNTAAVYQFKGLGGHPLDLRLDVLNALDAKGQIRDGTSLARGSPQWMIGRGVFVGIEQAF